MTADQPLDERAEARIREACPRHKIRTISNTIASEDFDLLAYPCTCPIQRAAILADRTSSRLFLAALVVEEVAHADFLSDRLRELDVVAIGPLQWGQRGVKIRAAKRAAKAALAAHDKRRGR